MSTPGLPRNPNPESTSLDRGLRRLRKRYERDLDGDGLAEIVAATDGGVVAYHRDHYAGGAWAAATAVAGDACRDLWFDGDASLCRSFVS